MVFPLREERQEQCRDGTDDAAGRGAVLGQQPADEPEERTRDRQTVEPVALQPSECVESQHAPYRRADEPQEVADQKPIHLVTPPSVPTVVPGRPIITLD